MTRALELGLIDARDADFAARFAALENSAARVERGSSRSASR